MLDILIKNGLIVDGTGDPGHIGDIAVMNSKVVQLAEHIELEAETVIDASGLVVSPGFIDCHTHSDTSVFTGSDSYNYLEQGVTTQVAGQCGSSPAPYSEGQLDSIRSYGNENQFALWQAQAATPSSFMETAAQAKLGTNMAFFIGHGALRANVMGYADNVPTPKQLDAMKVLLKQAMEAGYLGYSSGLVYAPSVYANTAELIELANVLAEYDGIYASHIRSEGNAVCTALAEALSIGKEAGVTCWISHLKVSGKANEGMSCALLAQIDKALAAGQSVYADQYPYNAGSAPLISQIPPRFLVGGKDVFLARAKSPQIRQEIFNAIFNEADVFESGIYSAGFDKCLVVEAAHTPQHINHTLAEIAEAEQKSPIDALCDLLIANHGDGQGIYFNQSASDIMRIMEHTRVFCGSDWSDYPVSVDPNQQGNGHPRGTGSMVRRLELERDFNIRSLEASVRNLTLDPAAALGLNGQGCIHEGGDANIAVFDYHNLHAPADYIHPYKHNTGIEYVLVNGKLAVQHGKALGVRAGKLLKRNR